MSGDWQFLLPREAPPKVIWLMVGNAGTGSIAELLQRHAGTIEKFGASPEESLLVLETGQPEGA